MFGKLTSWLLKTGSGKVKWYGVWSWLERRERRCDLYNTASTAQQREEGAPRDGTRPGRKGKARTINEWRKTAKKAKQGETWKANRTLRTLNRINSLMPLQDRRHAFFLILLEGFNNGSLNKNNKLCSQMQKRTGIIKKLNTV